MSSISFQIINFNFKRTANGDERGKKMFYRRYIECFRRGYSRCRVGFIIIDCETGQMQVVMTSRRTLCLYITSIIIDLIEFGV